MCKCGEFELETSEFVWIKQEGSRGGQWENPSTTPQFYFSIFPIYSPLFPFKQHAMWIYRLTHINFKCSLQGFIEDLEALDREISVENDKISKPKNCFSRRNKSSVAFLIVKYAARDFSDVSECEGGRNSVGRCRQVAIYNMLSLFPCLHLYLELQLNLSFKQDFWGKWEERGWILIPARCTGLDQVHSSLIAWRHSIKMQGI